MKSILFYKLFIICISCTFFFSSCIKNTDDLLSSKHDNQVFKRNVLLSKTYNLLNSKYAEEKYLNIAIEKYLLLDRQNQFSLNLRQKFGLPLWDISISLNNSNGLFTLVVPFEKQFNGKDLLLFAYFETENKVFFKLVDNKTDQNKLSKNRSNQQNNGISIETLNWLFKTSSDNKIKYGISKDSRQNKATENSYKSNEVLLQWECWWTYGWNEQGDFWTTQTQCRYNIIVSPQNITLLEPNLDIPSGGGGGSIVSYSPNQMGKALYEKINQVTDTCLRKIVSKIGNSSLNDDFSRQFVENFINLGNSTNIIFRENYNILDGPGWSFPDPFNNTSWVVEINPLHLSNSSAEYISSVIAHEIAHYYIELYFQSNMYSISTNYNHHYNMFTNWVNSISGMLRSIHPTLSLLDSRALALGGMSDVLGNSIKDSGFYSSFNNFAVTNYGISITDANIIRKTYELGVTGTNKCN